MIIYRSFVYFRSDGQKKAKWRTVLNDVIKLLVADLLIFEYARSCR